MNEQSRNMNEIEKAEFDEKKKVAAKDYADRKNEARAKIMAYLESAESKKLPEEVREAILYISGKGVRSARSGVNSELKSLLLKGPLTLMEVFEKFDIGIPSMEQKIRSFVNTKNAEDRIWVEFKDRTYTVVGTGSKAPTDYTGPKPKAEIKVVEEDTL